MLEPKQKFAKQFRDRVLVARMLIILLPLLKRASRNSPMLMFYHLHHVHYPHSNPLMYRAIRTMNVARIQSWGICLFMSRVLSAPFICKPVELNILIASMANSVLCLRNRKNKKRTTPKKYSLASPGVEPGAFPSWIGNLERSRPGAMLYHWAMSPSIWSFF